MTYSKPFTASYDVFKKQTTYDQIVKQLHKVFQEHNIKTVLDVGCGTGAITNKLHKQGYEILGVDTSKEMIAHAKNKYPQTPFQEANITTLHLNKKFDAIIAIDSVLTFIQTTNELNQALSNLTKHLSSKGILYLEIAFTKKTIPPGYTDKQTQKVTVNKQTYKKISKQKQEQEHLTTHITIYKDDEIITQEEHKHQILDEQEIRRELIKQGLQVTTTGNTPSPNYQPLTIVATKT